MASFQVPYLSWRDSAGTFTGALIEYPEATAVGANLKEVEGQLKEYLVWLYKEIPHHDPPDFREPRLEQRTVEIRPEYRDDDRVYPCSDALRLSVACVVGVGRPPARPIARRPLRPRAARRAGARVRVPQSWHQAARRRGRRGDRGAA